MNDQRLRPSSESRFDCLAMEVDLAAEAAAIRAEASSPHGHRQKALFKHGKCTVAIFVLDAGACLAEHKTVGLVTIQPVEGEITVTAEGRTHRLCSGRLLVLAPNVAHAVMTERGASFLLQVSLIAE